LAALVACAPAAPLPLPEGRSILLMFEDDGAKLFGIDSDGGPPPPFTFSRDGALYALAYDAPLGALAVPAGLTTAFDGVAAGRRLPAGYRAHRADLDRDPPSWSPIDPNELPDPIRLFELPGLSLGPCEEMGGCFRFAEGTERCEIPCVEPVFERRAPDPPAPPAIPDATPCAPGFEEVAPDGARNFPICRALESSCAAGEVHFLGDAACSPAGGRCPAGDYADPLPAGDVLYVRAGAASPGDGSLGAPFPSITDAIGRAAPGSVIAVAKGVYDEAVTVDRDVHLAGACRETIVRGPVARMRAVIGVAASATVASLRIEPMGSIGLVVEPSAYATIRDVEVSRVPTGIAVLGTADIDRAAVLDVTLAGVRVDGRASLDQVVVDGGADGVDVAGIAEINGLRATDLTADALEASGGSITVVGFAARGVARGIDVLDGAVAEVSAFDIGAASEFAIRARSSDLSVEDGMVLECREGIRVVGSAATIADTWIDGSSNENFIAEQASVANLERVVLSGTSKFGIHVVRSRATLRDVRIRDNLLDRSDGEGIVLFGEASIDAARVAIERVGDFGIHALDGGGASDVVLEDVAITDVAPTAENAYGIAFGDYSPPNPAATPLSATRLSIARVRFGIDLVTGESNRIEDLGIAEVAAGIRTIGGTLVVTRAEVGDVSGTAFSVASGELELNDLVLAGGDIGVRSAGWINTPVSGVDSKVNLTRFLITGADRCILLDQNSRSALNLGIVSACGTGLEVAATGYDLCMVEGDVIYRMNESHNLLVTGTQASHCSGSALSSSVGSGR
jgi:hypothetical protein